MYVRQNSSIFANQKTRESGVRKRVVSKRVVLADVPPKRKPERGYVRQNHPFGNRPFISPMTLFVVDKRVVSKRVVSADVRPERKPERGHVRQNHPFTKPPFYLPVREGRGCFRGLFGGSTGKTPGKIPGKLLEKIFPESRNAIGSPQMWVWPQLVFGGSPPPIPHCNWRTLPSSQTPSLPALSFPLPPTPLGSFCKAPGGGGPSWRGGRGPRAQGGGGQAALGARPTSGGTRCYEFWDLGTGKGKPAGNLGPTLPAPFGHFKWGGP